ncbi:Protein mak16 [Dictyocoela muelleri]|nr:Protein mak16 [Dictyocoela muelleri]
MSDENIWKMIGGDKNYCTYKLKTDTISLCKNKYNVTGICDRISCPLANSKYATIKEENGKIFALLKEPERNNTPSNRYEKIEIIDFNQIDEILKYFNKDIIHRCKQRYVKLIKCLERKEIIDKEGVPEIIPKRKRQLRIERSRGKKEFMKLDIKKQVQEELIERMKIGMYGDQLVEKLKGTYERDKKRKLKRRKFYADFINEKGKRDEKELEKEIEKEIKKEYSLEW